MDAVVFAKGVLLGTIASVLVILYAYRFQDYSRSVFVIYAALLMLLLVGSRASFRLVGEFVDRRRTSGRRCVIYGTGSIALATIREAFGDEPFNLIGFVDDDPAQVNRRLSGYAVLGGFRRLIALIEHGELDCVVLNTRAIDVERLQRLDVTCRNHGVDLVRLQLDLKRFTAAS
jgi:UDP-GlcNAc:undecaprenyl-phosphate GlcNAc-1-phosphate transferase